MKRHWDPEELLEHWTLLPSEHALLANKTGTTRLGFAVLLKFFQYEARFPTQAQEVPSLVVAHVAKQVEVPAEAFTAYDWQSRTIKYHGPAGAFVQKPTVSWEVLGSAEVTSDRDPLGSLR
jgi:hypothetical protein